MPSLILNYSVLSMIEFFGQRAEPSDIAVVLLLILLEGVLSIDNALVLGLLGVVLMRFAAVVFIRLLERFPRFETSAYLLVIVIGLKLSLDWWFNKRPPDWPVDKPFHGPLDFHNVTSAAFWSFWIMMAICFAIGFIPKESRTLEPETTSQ